MQHPLCIIVGRVVGIWCFGGISLLLTAPSSRGSRRQFDNVTISVLPSFRTLPGVQQARSDPADQRRANPNLIMPLLSTCTRGPTLEHARRLRPESSNIPLRSPEPALSDAAGRARPRSTPGPGWASFANLTRLHYTHAIPRFAAPSSASRPR